LLKFTRSADILVVATGIPGLIKPHMVKEGVAVIDIGINRVKDEKTGKFKLVGDVDFEGNLYTGTVKPLYYIKDNFGTDSSCP
jgi:methylenetetrahydrofolate dehydrogenase(NAD+)/5,10-methenyltetrahydrofolate cyclohydrolase